MKTFKVILVTPTGTTSQMIEGEFFYVDEGGNLIFMAGCGKNPQMGAFNGRNWLSVQAIVAVVAADSQRCECKEGGS